jgi:hypothetical protein
VVDAFRGEPIGSADRALRERLEPSITRLDAVTFGR